MAKIEISKDQNTVTIDSIEKHYFNTNYFDPKLTTCSICSLNKQCSLLTEKNVFNPIPCLVSERKDLEDGYFSLDKP